MAGRRPVVGSHSAATLCSSLYRAGSLSRTTFCPAQTRHATQRSPIKNKKARKGKKGKKGSKASKSSKKRKRGDSEADGDNENEAAAGVDTFFIKVQKVAPGETPTNAEAGEVA